MAVNEKIELDGVLPDGARGIDWNYTGEYAAVVDNDGLILTYNRKDELIRKFLNQTNSTNSIIIIDWHHKENILTTVTDKVRFFDIEKNLLKSIKYRPEELILFSIA